MLKIYLSILHNIFAAGLWSQIQARDPITELGEEGHEECARRLSQLMLAFKSTALQ